MPDVAATNLEHQIRSQPDALAALLGSADVRRQVHEAAEGLHRARRLWVVGTGTSLQYITGRAHDWGYAQWAKPLLSLMLDGTAGIADYQCSQVLGNRYHRLAPVFPAGVSVPMDAVDRIPYMIDFAKNLPIDDIIDWLRTTWGAGRRRRAGAPRSRGRSR